MASRRRTRPELKKLLLDTGVELLRTEGLTGGIDGVTLPKAFAAIRAETGEKVTAGSVYERIWRDQRSYQLDVIHEAAWAYPNRGAANAAVVRAAVESPRPSSLEQLGRVRALCVVTAEAVLSLLETSRDWLLWMAIYACTASTPEVDDDDAVMEPIHLGYQATENLYEPLVDSLCALGITPRDHHAHREFVIDAAAVTEGLALRSRFAPTRSDSLHPAAQARRHQRAKVFLADALEALIREGLATGQFDHDPSLEQPRLV